MKTRLIPILRNILILPLLWIAPPAWADGTLTHLSGTVTVKKTDGRAIPGAMGEKVVAGETIITGDKGYVRLEMSDGSEMVLRPDSEFKIDAYHFNKDKPQEDSSVFSMLKGGLRKITGLIGKRGNQDAYKMQTPTATIGIRGTQFDLRVCNGNCGTLANGTYAAVRFGAILAANPQGSQVVPAGKVVFVPPQTPPVILPRDPGIGFTPPPVIPKLDEKKKQQDQAKTDEQAKPAQPAQQGSGADKPATDNKPQKTDEKPKGQDDAEPVSAQQGSGTATTTQQAAGSSSSGQETPSQASPAAASSPQPQAVQCVIQ